MTHYHLSQKYPHSEFLQVEITFQVNKPQSTPLSLRLPAWRPGRYQLGNFAKNIRNFSVKDIKGNSIPYIKKSRDHWQINASVDTVKVSYEYYTSEIDGGSTYVDEEQWYLNFINCLMYLEDRLDEPCEVQLMVPENNIIACGLPSKESILYAKSFYQLVDSPAIVSTELKHLQYDIEGIVFHLWFKGDVQLNLQEKILEDFKRFTTTQLRMMGAFEDESYHFLYQIPDTKAYHGVEHLNSTCIVLGPAKEFNTDAFYDNFLGISSHELFHYWNIIRIRPKEMVPYDFTKENYFTTGYVAEGVTTYYGDLFLIRSGVKDLSWYQDELNKLLRRHFDNNGRFNYSVADSSMDLWIDGYEPGTPDRKVSIYVKGAIIALLLDMLIIKETNTEKSLDDVMRILWSDYYKKGKGYSAEDYLHVAESVIGRSLAEYSKEYIDGTSPVENILTELCPSFGFEMIEKYPENPLSKFFGIKYTENPEGFVINKTAPKSPAEEKFRKDDIIISINGKDVKNFEMESLQYLNTIAIHVMRKGKMRKFEMNKKAGDQYFIYFELIAQPNLTTEQINFRKKWLNV